MSAPWILPDIRDADLPTLAGLIAFALRPGDTVTLSGALGAGKTTFARAMIRALLDDPAADVPSPTFSLVQPYDTPRFPVAHADLYRLAEGADLTELGLDEALAAGVVLIEWPERAVSQLSADRLEIRFDETHGVDRRDITVSPHGGWPPRLARLAAMHQLLVTAGLSGAAVRYLLGDASPRRYARLRRPVSDQRSDTFPTALLMDAPRQPDGPPIRDGLPYSRIAHLAEDVRPFVAVTAALRQAQLSAPAIYAGDLERGLLLLEDLGDRVFGAELVAGGSQIELWRAATEALLALRRVPVPESLQLPDGSVYRLPAYDRAALGIETELLVDWYWPALLASPAPAQARAAFTAAWQQIFDRLLGLPKGWVLRDYHSPNLIWLAERSGLAKVGIIDFQDALTGHAAYDLVSLLQDARLDVAASIESELLAHYCNAATAGEPGFSEPDFRFAYAALGAQRNTKILGIFARLARRDGKPQYLRHIPRIWGYLARNLAAPGLEPLRAWYDRHLPIDLRQRELSP